MSVNVLLKISENLFNFILFDKDKISAIYVHSDIIHYLSSIIVSQCYDSFQFHLTETLLLI